MFPVVKRAPLDGAPRPPGGLGLGGGALFEKHFFRLIPHSVSRIESVNVWWDEIPPVDDHV